MPLRMNFPRKNLDARNPGFRQRGVFAVSALIKMRKFARFHATLRKTRRDIFCLIIPLHKSRADIFPKTIPEIAHGAQFKALTDDSQQIVITLMPIAKSTKCIERLLLPLLLILIGIGYYALYFRANYNLADGGSVALLSERLLHGERPIADVYLAYNVLWFYPIVGLFKLFGVNFLVLRVWFFSLGIVNALLAFFLIRRAVKNRFGAIVAFVGALGILLVPGTINKTYIAFCVLANGHCLLGVIRSGWDRRSLKKCGWFIAGGALLGITFLLRIDIGIFFVALWIAISGLLLLEPAERFWKKCAGVIVGLILLSLTVILVHLPIFFAAQNRGFATEFVAQYTSSLRYIGHRFDALFGHSQFPKSALLKTNAAVLAKANGTIANVNSVAKLSENQPTKKTAESRANLNRAPLSNFWRAKKADDSQFALLTYAPLFAAVGIGLWALCIGIGGLFKRDPNAWKISLTTIALTGAAFTDFPQFFWFRPDPPHLSEFMPGLIAIGAILVAWSIPAIWKTGFRKWLAIFFCIVSIFYFAIYLKYSLHSRSTGSIGLSRGRTELFTAQNGVSVFLRPKEKRGLTAIRDIVLRYSTPQDFVVCYPYAPGINFMTGRRTYERSLFVDNVSRPPNFDAQTVAKLKRFRPAVVVISDWKMNRNAASRFSSWAPRTMRFVKRHYHNRGTWLKQTVFTLR